MTPSTITGLLLIALPIAFNVAFAGLARRFEYPGILRQPVGTILEKFSAGGAGLVTLWWVFALIALAFVPIAAAAGAVVRSSSTSELGAWLAEVSIALGITAGLVQTLGLIRWPYLVPELARRYHGAADPAERWAAEVVFAAAHRLLGVGIGEGLGYLATGLWTVVFGLALLASGTVPADPRVHRDPGRPRGRTGHVRVRRQPTSRRARSASGRSCPSRTSRGRSGCSRWASASCSASAEPPGASHGSGGFGDLIAAGRYPVVRLERPRERAGELPRPVELEREVVVRVADERDSGPMRGHARRRAGGLA